MKHIKKFNEEFFHSLHDQTDIKELGTENKNFNKVIDILERDCKPFLDEVKSKNISPIFRGAYPSNTEEVDNLGLYKKKVRTDRKTLDTNKEISNMFDDEFEKKFGVRPRLTGVFTTKKYDTTSAYGIRNIFIPIGEYQYYWNPKCIDLYPKINTQSWYRRFTKPELNKFYKEKNLVKKFYDFITNNNLGKEVTSSIRKLVKGYKDNDLEKNTNQEIMFICKEYYLLDASWIEYYKEYLNNRR